MKHKQNCETYLNEMSPKKLSEKKRIEAQIQKTVFQTYFWNNQNGYTCIEKVNWYSQELEFHYWDMSIWNWLKLGNFFHFSQNIMQHNKKIFLERDDHMLDKAYCV